MYRRDFMKLTGTGGLTLIAGRALANKPQQDKPNLLIIHTDEHNFRTLGCYRDTLPKKQAFMWGPSVVETPHIDWLAKEGALCTSFYATAPVCSPSRASFVTGMYPQNTPVETNNIRLDDNVITFAEILRRNGYATGYAGKWHLDGNAKPGWEPPRDFGFEDNRYMFNRGHWKLANMVDGKPEVGMKDGKPSYAPIGDEKTFMTDWLCDRAIDFIETQKDKPFCYMISIPDPHGPDTVRAPYDTMYADQEYEQPRSAKKPDKGLPGWGKKQSNSFNQAKYYGMVKCIDDNVGKLVKYLERAKLLDDTIVVFTSDHGDLRGEHGRQNKGVPYEGSAKIPFVVRWPRKIKKKTIIHEALDCTAFLPTVLALMDVPTAGKEEGRDASSLLINGQAPSDWDDIAFIRAASVSPKAWLAAVTSRYKLIFSGYDEPWFFDLETDPDELVNHFDKPAHRDTIRSMAKALREYGEKHNEPRIKDENIAADLAWSIGPEKTYTPHRRPAAPPKAGGKKKQKKRRKNA